MKEKILALLISKFPGVRKDGLAHMARILALHVADEKEAESMVEKLTDAQVNETIKDFRAEIDKEVSNANKTFETNLRSKFDLVEKKKKGDDEPKPNADANADIAAIVADAIAKAVAPLNERLAGMDAENVAKTRLSKLTESLAKCKDESFRAQTLKDFNRMQFADDAAFEEYLTEKAKDADAANQRVANETMNRGGGAPAFGQKNTEGVTKAVADYVASKNADGNNLGGKEI